MMMREYTDRKKKKRNEKRVLREGWKYFFGRLLSLSFSLLSLALACFCCARALRLLFHPFFGFKR